MRKRGPFQGFLRDVALSAFLVMCFTVSPAQPQPAWTLGPFTRPVQAPLITPDPKATFNDPLRQAAVHWEALHTFNPAAVARDGKIFVLYRAEDDTGEMKIGLHTSRLGLAQSEDGVHFTRLATPVFYPAKDAQENREWPGGTEDPRIVEAPDGTYVLTYTQWNRKTYTVGIATSKDLLTWKKYGPAFADASQGKYAHLEYKSAGILTQLVHGRLIAAKLHGKYWMYWGEVTVRLATSPDLIHWTPVEKTAGHPVVLLRRRPGLFDSELPEVGAPPLLTPKGIVLLYNGKNAMHGGASGLDPGAYSSGQALFSADDPTKLLARTSQPYFKPEMPFEKSGQYAAGTTFVEGLVYFHDKWVLYYGCADTFVGVAVADRPLAATLQ
ncbi:MAG: glycoside hydrolase family 130 protein [Acidobacteriaceae bacterium]